MEVCFLWLTPAADFEHLKILANLDLLFPWQLLVWFGSCGKQLLVRWECSFQISKGRDWQQIAQSSSCFHENRIRIVILISPQMLRKWLSCSSKWVLSWNLPQCAAKIPSIGGFLFLPMLQCFVLTFSPLFSFFSPFLFFPPPHKKQNQLIS